MSLTDKSANAVGGRTARACDGCIRRRARWYCAADDAFLCQACDASVHTANSLASRHDRVRLKTSSCYPHPPLPILDGAPTWHHGFKRKPRTPRAKPGVSGTKFEPVPVPDLDASGDEEEELLYRVPIFDPVLAEFCDDSNGLIEENVTPLVAPLDNGSHASSVAAAGPAGFHELAELDVESLLGFDDEQYCMEGLGLVEVREEDEGCCQVADAGGVKMEVEGVEVATGCHVDVKMEFCRETLDFDFEYGSPEGVERRLNLRLDCDAVMSAWGGRGCSAWIDGQRPQLSLDDWWPEPDYTGMWGGGEEVGVAYGGHVGHVALGDGRREARVTRYREKRRTRLFSKKIRYEVRKLNAEKRPRMKGRFVKRASFPPVSGFRN